MEKVIEKKMKLVAEPIIGYWLDIGRMDDYKKAQEEWDKKVKEDLKLTSDQVVKYDALSKEYSDKLSAVAQDATLSKETQKERKMALKKEKEAKLFEFLTPEQQNKYRELIEQKKKEMEKTAKDKY